MNTTTPDWELYAEAWRDDLPHSAELRTLNRALLRRRLEMVLVVLGELALTAGLVAWTWSLRQDPELPVAAWVVGGIWAVWLVATLFAWWNRRGQWVADVASLEEYAELSLERAVRKIRVVWFSLGLTVVQLGLLWVVAGGAGGWFWAVALTTSAAVSGWCVWYWRRAVAEREYFGELVGANE